MRADGFEETRLTFNPAADEAPALSADGTQIAFASTRDGNSEIYVMNADGSDQRRLTFDDAIDAAPTWSPDATRIAFTSNRASASSVYVMNADGTEVRRLTYAANPDYDPAWSPDGSKIAFAATRDGNFEIYVMNADGSGQQRITKDSDTDSLDDQGPRTITSLGTDNQPAWSPDGRRIAFRTGGAPGEIYVMDADGSGSKLLAVQGEDPSWSTDGDRIAFAQYGLIYSVKTDGSDRTRTQLTDGHAPSWSR